MRAQEPGAPPDAHPAGGAPTSPDPPRPEGTDPRRWHYRSFYGLVEAGQGAGVVVGNCQAESIRLVIDTPDTPTVRVPPVHELEPDDLPHLDRALASAPFVVTQPIRDDYRDLPVGTGQLRDTLPAGRPLVVVPSVRFAGLQPFQTAMRVPGVPGDPPLVPYHDVRVLAAAGGVRTRERLDPDAVRALAAESLAELARREEEAGALPVSDVLSHPRFELMRTVNHAGNHVWLTLGARVLEALGSAHGPTDPGRRLLAGIESPREGWVAEVWGSDEPVSPMWRVDGDELDPARVRAEHEAWYREHPRFVPAALERLAPVLRHWAPA